MRLSVSAAAGASIALLILSIGCASASNPGPGLRLSSSDTASSIIESGEGGSPPPPKAPNANSINMLRKAKINGAGAIPPDQRILETTYEFELYQDDAHCKSGDGDTDDNWPSNIYFGGVPDPAACANLCSDCPGQLSEFTLRGFELDSDSNCACLVDSGVAFSAETCPGHAGTRVNTGSGPIVSHQTNSGFVCYRVVEPEQPSSQPSLVPSSLPSEVPSSKPSLSPSDQPSSDPSSDPSYDPSSMPSCTPSSAPTESPSTRFGVNLFYPIWEQSFNGCRNDGDEPDYMAVNPTEWLLSTLDACCKKYFNGFLYDACIGRYPPDHDDCITALFYPDWNGSNEGCVDDGKEPYYMLSNVNYFLSNSIEECCEKFYEWNYFSCTGMKSELTNGEYYPDWTGSSTATCPNDDKMPTYMLNNQGWYLSTTLEKCCERHFYWGLKECLGTADVGTNEWYVSYGDGTCVQDCNGASPCGGIADSWVELFKSKEKCCEDTLPWKPRCRFY